MRSLAELALAALPINQQVYAVDQLNLNPVLRSQVNRRLAWIRLTRGVLRAAARRRAALAAEAARRARDNLIRRSSAYSSAQNRRRDFFRGRGRGRN